MNRDHLNALLTANGPSLVVRHEGRIIATEGHIAAEADFPPTDDDPKKVAAMEKFATNWKNWSEADWPVVQPADSVFNNYPRFIRRIGTFFINEAFYRTFESATATWHSSDNIDNPLLVEENGRLVAAVVANRRDDDPVKIAAPADAEVFESFATYGNGYYLQGDDILIAEINNVRIECSELREKIADLKQELQEEEAELERKQAVLDARRKRRIAA